MCQWCVSKCLNFPNFYDDEYNIKRERGSMGFESLADKYLELLAKVNKKGWKKADKIYLG